MGCASSADRANAPASGSPALQGSRSADRMGTKSLLPKLFGNGGSQQGSITERDEELNELHDEYNRSQYRMLFQLFGIAVDLYDSLGSRRDSFAGRTSMLVKQHSERTEGAVIPGFHGDVSMPLLNPKIYESVTASFSPVYKDPVPFSEFDIFATDRYPSGPNPYTSGLLKPSKRTALDVLADSKRDFVPTNSLIGEIKSRQKQYEREGWSKTKPIIDVTPDTVLHGCERGPNSHLTPWYTRSGVMRLREALENRDRAVMSATGRTEIQEEYAYVHLRCVNLRKHRFAGRFMPFATILRSRSVREGQEPVWDVIASTSIAPATLGDPQAIEMRKHDLFRFIKRRYAFNRAEIEQEVSDEFLQQSPSFSPIILPRKYVVEGEPGTRFRILIQHQGSLSTRVVAVAEVDLAQLRALAMRQRPQAIRQHHLEHFLLNLVPLDIQLGPNGEIQSGLPNTNAPVDANDFQRQGGGGTSQALPNLEDPAVSPSLALAAVITRCIADYNFQQSFDSSSVSTSQSKLFLAIRQPLLETTAAALITPLYRPVPNLLRLGVVRLQIMTSKVILSLTNSGTKNKISRAYLRFSTFKKRIRTRRELADYPSVYSSAAGAAVAANDLEQVKQQLVEDRKSGNENGEHDYGVGLDALPHEKSGFIIDAMKTKHPSSKFVANPFLSPSGAMLSAAHPDISGHSRALAGMNLGALGNTISESLLEQMLTIRATNAVAAAAETAQSMSGTFRTLRQIQSALEKDALADAGKNSSALEQQRLRRKQIADNLQANAISTVSSSGASAIGLLPSYVTERAAEQAALEAKLLENPDPTLGHAKPRYKFQVGAVAGKLWAYFTGQKEAAVELLHQQPNLPGSRVSTNQANEIRSKSKSIRRQMRRASRDFGASTGAALAATAGIVADADVQALVRAALTSIQKDTPTTSRSTSLRVSQDGGNSDSDEIDEILERDNDVTSDSEELDDDSDSVASDVSDVSFSSLESIPDDSLRKAPTTWGLPTNVEGSNPQAKNTTLSVPTSSLTQHSEPADGDTDDADADVESTFVSGPRAPAVSKRSYGLNDSDVLANSMSDTEEISMGRSDNVGRAGELLQKFRETKGVRKDSEKPQGASGTTEVETSQPLASKLHPPASLPPVNLRLCDDSDFEPSVSRADPEASPVPKVTRQFAPPSLTPRRSNADQDSHRRGLADSTQGDYSDGEARQRLGTSVSDVHPVQVHGKVASILGLTPMPEQSALQADQQVMTQLPAENVVEEAPAYDEYEVVTVHVTESIQSLGALSWVVTAPVLALTGGLGDFDQQLMITVIDVTDEPRECAFTITTLRQLLLQGTFEWNLFSTADVRNFPISTPLPLRDPSQMPQRKLQRGDAANLPPDLVSALLNGTVPLETFTTRTALEPGTLRTVGTDPLKTPSILPGGNTPNHVMTPGVTPSVASSRYGSGFMGMFSGPTPTAFSIASGKGMSLGAGPGRRASLAKLRRMSQTMCSGWEQSLVTERYRIYEGVATYEPRLVQVGTLQIRSAQIYNFIADAEDAALRDLVHDLGSIEEMKKRVQLYTHYNDIFAEPAQPTAHGKLAISSTSQLLDHPLGSSTLVTSSLASHRRQQHIAETSLARAYVARLCLPDYVNGEFKPVLGGIVNITSDSLDAPQLLSPDLRETSLTPKVVSSPEVSQLHKEVGTPPLHPISSTHFTLARSAVPLGHGRSLVPHNDAQFPNTLYSAKTSYASAQADLSRIQHPVPALTHVPSRSERLQADLADSASHVMLSPATQRRFLARARPADPSNVKLDFGAASAADEQTLEEDGSPVNHLEKLQETFASWMIGKRYEQYLCFNFMAVGVQPGRVYEMEIYVMRRGQYELFKVSPHVVPIRNGGIYAAHFDPIVLKGLYAIESPRISPVRAPPSIFVDPVTQRVVRRFSSTSGAAAASKLQYGGLDPAIDQLLNEIQGYDDDIDDADGSNSLQSCQALAAHVSRDKRFLFYNRLLISVAMPVWNPHMSPEQRQIEAEKHAKRIEKLRRERDKALGLGSGNLHKTNSALNEAVLSALPGSKTICGPGYTGLNDRDESWEVQTVRAPLAIFNVEEEQSGSLSEMSMIAKPGKVIGLGERQVRLRPNVDRIGFVEVFYEDMREESHTKRDSSQLRPIALPLLVHKPDNSGNAGVADDEKQVSASSDQDRPKSHEVSSVSLELQHLTLAPYDLIRSERILEAQIKAARREYKRLQQEEKLDKKREEKRRQHANQLAEFNEFQKHTAMTTPLPGLP